MYTHGTSTGKRLRTLAICRLEISHRYQPVKQNHGDEKRVRNRHRTVLEGLHAGHSRFPVLAHLYHTQDSRVIGCADFDRELLQLVQRQRGG